MAPPNVTGRQNISHDVNTLYIVRANEIGQVLHEGQGVALQSDPTVSAVRRHQRQRYNISVPNQSRATAC